MFQLNPGTHMPVYEQIKEMIKNLIVSGVLKENEKIPSVRELALQMTINPNTIQKAYKELESDGYIYSLRAKGYFVSPIEMFKFGKRVDYIMNELEGKISELYYLGVEKKDINTLIDKIYSGGNADD